MHLLEVFTKRLLQKFNNIWLISRKIDEYSSEIHTSIQYEGVGSGPQSNAEFDLVALKNDVLIMIEYKFNKTRYSDIKGF